MTCEEISERLGLEPIDQEGGWFKRIYTGKLESDGRADCTTIYALFTREQFSALHRLDAVEQFFFLDGDAFEVFRIGSDGVGRTELLGKELALGESPHLVFQAGDWFGGTPVEGGAFGWTLMSCVVTPGFEWEGFEVGERAVLVASYPEYGDAIGRLTRVSAGTADATSSG